MRSGAFFVSSGNVTSTFTLDKTEILVCYQIPRLFTRNTGAIRRFLIVRKRIYKERPPQAPIKPNQNG